MLVLFYLTRNHIREPFILSGHARVMSQINVVLPTTIHLPIELHRLGDSVQIAVRNTEPWWYLRSECLTTFLSWFTAIDSAHAHAAACFPWSGFFFFFLATQPKDPATGWRMGCQSDPIRSESEKEYVWQHPSVEDAVH